MRLQSKIGTKACNKLIRKHKTNENERKQNPGPAKRSNKDRYRCTHRSASCLKILFLVHVLITSFELQTRRDFSQETGCFSEKSGIRQGTCKSPNVIIYVNTDTSACGNPPTELAFYLSYALRVLYVPDFEGSSF